MTRGIASVGSGPGIGGLIEAQSKKAEFTSDHEFDSQGDIVASAMSNDGYAASGVIGAANVNHRLQIVGSYEDGDDMEYGERHDRRHTIRALDVRCRLRLSLGLQRRRSGLFVHGDGI